MSKRLRKTLPEQRLSPSEWEIMRICWDLGRCTVREVLKEDLKSHKRDYRTVLTFMGRMTNKGWLKATSEGRRNYYEPLIDKPSALSAEIRAFLDNVVGSDPRGLAMVRRELSARSTTGARSGVNRRQRDT